MDGDALLSKIPRQIWNDLGVDPAQAATSVTAGRIRRLISHGKVLVTQFQTSGRAPAGTPNAGSLCPPSWQEHAPPRLTPESVAALSAMFTKNFPGELLIAETLPSTRSLASGSLASYITNFNQVRLCAMCRGSSGCPKSSARR